MRVALVLGTMDISKAILTGIVTEFGILLA